MPPEDWPGRALSRIIQSAPHRWHVQVKGTGPDLLLLHGAGGSLHSWFRVAPDLAKRYRVITIDLPGHGFTHSPRGRARLSNVAADIAKLAQAEGWHPHAVIGHSAGGAIALQIAADHILRPERLVIVNGALENFKGHAGWMFPLLAKMLALNPFTGFMISQGSASRSQVRSIMRSAGTDLDDEALGYYAQLIGRRRHVDGTLAMMAQWSLDDLARTMPSIGVPTLFIHGEKDAAVPITVAERAAAVLPNARLDRLQDVGHLAQEEAPEAVLQAIDGFLTLHPAQ